MTNRLGPPTLRNVVRPLPRNRRMAGLARWARLFRCPWSDLFLWEQDIRVDLVEFQRTLGGDEDAGSNRTPDTDFQPVFRSAKTSRFVPAGRCSTVNANSGPRCTSNACRAMSFASIAILFASLAFLTARHAATPAPTAITTPIQPTTSMNRNYRAPWSAHRKAVA